jgi:hypothetical protein
VHGLRYDEHVNSHIPSNTAIPFSCITYNVNGLLSKLEDSEFVNMLQNYDFVCLTETFLPFDFESILFDDYVIFSSHAVKLSHQGRHSGGVVVMIKKKYACYFEHIPNDIKNTVVLKLDKLFLGTDKDVMFISMYVPPIESKFWQTGENGHGIDVLENVVMALHEKCKDFSIILCGDINARTASNNFSISFLDDFDKMEVEATSVYSRVSQDEQENAFGQQLIEFCNIFDAVILNGLNLYSFDDSYTYIASNGSSVLDYFIVSRSMIHTSVVRSLKVKSVTFSDHLPLELILNVFGKNRENLLAKEKEDKGPSKITKLIWDKDKVSQYKDNIKSQNCQKLFDEAFIQADIDINESFKQFNKGLIVASNCMIKTVSSQRKMKNKGAPWFDAECTLAKKTCRTKLNLFRKNRQDDFRKDYVLERKKYKLLIRQKKRQFQKSRAEFLLDNMHDSSVFWKELKNLGGEKKDQIKQDIDVDEWYEHFQKLFGQNETDEANTDNSRACNEEEEADPFLNNRITIEEVKQAIKELNSGKASGTDGIVAEMLKEGGDVVSNYILKLFNIVFDLGVFPNEWAKAIIVPIHKSGDINNVDNYRGISLINVTCKCFTLILNKRLTIWLEDQSIIVENQAGFRKAYSTTDHIFTLNAVIQKCMSRKGSKLYVAFVDLKKAFDSVHHFKLFDVLQKIRINGKFFKVLKAMYDKLMSCVRSNNRVTDFFDCPVGVRQGCGLSPTLFSLFINDLANHINENGVHGVQLLPSLVELFILLFADDIVLISTTPKGLQVQLNCLKSCCDKLRLNVNVDKTKVMVFRKGGYLGKFEKWYLGETRLEVVKQYCYLGYIFTTMLSYKIGTSHLVVKGKRAVYLLNKAFFNCKEMTQSIYFKVFEARVMSILLYSAEIWGLHRLDSLEKVHMLACKRYLGVPLISPNKMVYSELKRHPIYIYSVLRVIKYWFRLLEMENDRLPKQAYVMLVRLDDLGKTCWATGVREILSQCGFYCVWINQGVGNVKVFLSRLKQRLIDTFMQEWESTVLVKDRYAFYRSFKSSFGTVFYLECISIYCFCVAFTQLRLGVLPINNNLRRYSRNVLEKMCPFCPGSIEDELHLIYSCPSYSDIRIVFLNFDEYKPIPSLLGSANPLRICNVAKFTYYAVKRRSHLLAV